MSLQIRDNLSPAIARLAAKCRDRRPILEAMGAEFCSLSKRSFTDPSLRALPWPDKRDGTPATLRKSGALWQSIRITEITNDSVTSGSDRAYAAIHQLGGVSRPMPARPFFPILDGKLTALAKQRIEAVAKAKALALLK